MIHKKFIPLPPSKLCLPSAISILSILCPTRSYFSGKWAIAMASASTIIYALLPQSHKEARAPSCDQRQLQRRLAPLCPHSNTVNRLVTICLPSQKGNQSPLSFPVQGQSTALRGLGARLNRGDTVSSCFGLPNKVRSWPKLSD